MKCPFCGTDRDRVVDSRSSVSGRTIRRRRLCLSCKRRFTTHEAPPKGLDIPRERMIITIEVSEAAPTDEAAFEIFSLLRNINAFHIAFGGSGLEVDDWQMHLPVGKPVEVQ